MCQYLKTEGFDSSPVADIPQHQHSPLQSASVTVARIDPRCSDTADALALRAVHGALRGRLPFENTAQDHGSIAEKQGHQTAVIVLGSMQDGNVTDQVIRVGVILLTSKNANRLEICSPLGPKHNLSRPTIPPHAAGPSRF